MPSSVEVLGFDEARQGQGYTVLELVLEGHTALAVVVDFRLQQQNSF